MFTDQRVFVERSQNVYICNLIQPFFHNSIAQLYRQQKQKQNFEIKQAKRRYFWKVTFRVQPALKFKRTSAKN